MSATTSFLVDRWTADGDPNEWPYPTEYAQFRIDGELADRVRARTGATGDVHIVEREVSTGYSEYTTETDYEFDVLVDTQIVWTWNNGWNDGRTAGQTEDDLPRTSLAQLQAWLDEEPEA